MAMNAFKPGDSVVIVGGPRAGERAKIVAIAAPLSIIDIAAHPRWLTYGAQAGDPLAQLDLPSVTSVGTRCCALLRWLRLDDDGREKSEWTTELRRLCGVFEKETA